MFIPEAPGLDTVTISTLCGSERVEFGLQFLRGLGQIYRGLAAIYIDTRL